MPRHDYRWIACLLVAAQASTGCLSGMYRNALAERREASALLVRAEPAGEAGVELHWEATFASEIRQGSLELARSHGCPPVFAAADGRFVRPWALGAPAPLEFTTARYRITAHAFEGEVRSQEDPTSLALLRDPCGLIAIGGAVGDDGLTALLLVRNEGELVTTELYGPRTPGETTALGLLVGLDVVATPAAAVLFAPVIILIFAACGGGDC